MAPVTALPLTYEQQMAALRARAKAVRAPELAAQQARNLAEYESGVLPALEEHPGAKVIELQDSPSELPGYIVVRCPEPIEMTRWRQVAFKPATDRNATEARSTAGPNLGASCVVHPTRERYLELVAARAGVVDEVAAAALRLGQAGAEAEGKE